MDSNLRGVVEPPGNPRASPRFAGHAAAGDAPPDGVIRFVGSQVTEVEATSFIVDYEPPEEG